MCSTFSLQSATASRNSGNAYKFTEKRKRAALKKAMLSNVSWSAKHEAVFIYLEEKLKNAVRLSYPKEHYIVYVSTDAFDKCLVGITNQALEYEADKSIKEQEQELSGFLS